MKLRIENLGAVKEATIDLGKKLIIFCGPNGTGKTWTAYAIGGLFNANYVLALKQDFSLDALISLGSLELDVKPDAISDFWTLFAKGFQNRLKGILPVLSASEKDAFEYFDVSIAEETSTLKARYLSRKINTSTQFLGYHFHISKEENSSIITLNYTKSGSEMVIYDKNYSPIIASSIIQALAFAPISSRTVSPVERNSVYTFITELNLQKRLFYETLKNPPNSSEASRIFDPQISRTTRYPEAVRDALDIADDIANISRTASPYYEFGKEVEQILLQGKVSVGEGGEVDFAPGRAGGKSFSFQLSSSAVKTLSSLIIYLKYQAKPNELLIIDEPELNLHPDNQILLARVFAHMINKGIRLLISTHSDYIVRELNNLIMLSAPEPALKAVAEEFGYSEEEKIAREDVGVYLFQFKNPDDPFVTVEELPIADNGFEVPTIDEAIKKLNAASEEIYFTMKYGAGQGNGTD